MANDDPKCARRKILQQIECNATTAVSGLTVRSEHCCRRGVVRAARRGGRAKIGETQASRRNGSKSADPITEEGKRSSRCNAVRHRLTAETVIGMLEDTEDYRAFEAAIIADNNAQVRN